MFSSDFQRAVCSFGTFPCSPQKWHALLEVQSSIEMGAALRVASEKFAAKVETCMMESRVARSFGRDVPRHQPRGLGGLHYIVDGRPVTEAFGEGKPAVEAFADRLVATGANLRAGTYLLSQEGACTLAQLVGRAPGRAWTLDVRTEGEVRVTMESATTRAEASVDANGVQLHALLAR